MGAVLDATKKLARVINFDGWMNVITGLGTSKDKSTKATVVWNRLGEQECEEFYAGDDIAEKIVDKPIEEAFKTGYKFTGIDAQKDTVDAKAKRLGLEKHFREAWWKARLYGGGLLVKVTDDMADLEQPLTEGARIKGFFTLSRWEAWPSSTDIDQNPMSTRFGQPIFYTLFPRQTQTGKISGQKIHHSRVVRFDGAKLPDRLRIQNNHWNDSVLCKIWNVIRNFNTSHDSVALTIQDFSVVVFKLKGLADKIASEGAEGEAGVLQRVKLVNLTKSVANAVLIDADGEDFDHKTRTVTGLKDILEKVEERLVAATPLPKTILLGRSPEGLGGSGRHEQDNWYDYVNAQRTMIAPLLVEAHREILVECGVQPEQTDIEWNPLYEMDEKEMATNRKMQADADVAYINAGVLDPDEVALSRFGGEKYSYDTKIEKDLRNPRQSLMQPEQQIDPATGLPVPAPTPGVPGVTPPGAPSAAPGADPAGNAPRPLVQKTPAGARFNNHDGGPGSGPADGIRKADALAAYDAISKAMERERAAESKLGENLDEAGKSAAVGEYRAAVRARQKAVRDAKTILIRSQQKDGEELSRIAHFDVVPALPKFLAD